MASTRGVMKILSILVASMAYTSEPLLAAKKLALGTPVKGSPVYFLLPMAAEEKGFWKDQGLEVEWLSFSSGGHLDSALATDRAQLGINPTASVIIRAARGLMTPVIADLEAFQLWKLWVRSDSIYQSPKDMRGTKTGVTRLGDLTHSYGRVFFRTSALEREVKFVGVGGPREGVAALRAGAIDAFVTTYLVMVLLEYQGMVRGVAALSDYLPKDWNPITLNATKMALEKDPEAVSRVVKAILKAANFVVDNSSWPTQKMMVEMSWPEMVAKMALSEVRYSRDGRIHPERLEKMRDFLIEYGLVPKDKVPAVGELYTARLLPGR